MKFPRAIRLDSSDLQVFDRAAEPGEWALPGTFAFLERDPASFGNKEKIAFQSGWLGIGSFGWASLVEVAEIDEPSFDDLLDRLARHFVKHCGAPNLAEAMPTARQEADYAASLCSHKNCTLLSLAREYSDEGIVERFRVIKPDRAQDHARIWEIVTDGNEAI